MKLLIAICVVAAAFAVPVSDDDQYYWYEYGKFVATYRQDSDLHSATSKFNIFKANLQFINSENAKSTGTVYGVNEFADMSFEEFSSKYLGYKGVKSAAPKSHKISNAALPDAVDWRQKNAVTPVKNQGSCGSCWAFSAVASLEGAHSLKAGSLVSLSEQQLVDCSTSFGNQGCNGGLMDQAFQYLINATAGDDTETAYPYEGRDSSCRYSKDKVGASIASFVDVPAKDENALEDAAATVGPVSVAIHVTAGFQFYMGGVYNSFLCSSSQSSLNHGVAVVGYGAEGSKKFWIVKNSWGSGWGEKGYIRMARGKNLCGIADNASYPTV